MSNPAVEDNETAEDPFVKELRKGPHGFFKGEEAMKALPMLLKEKIQADPFLSHMGKIVAFSRWNDETQSQHFNYMQGHAAFQYLCMPCGCPPPFCCLCWCFCLPLVAWGAWTDLNPEVWEQTSLNKRRFYQLIFERHYVNIEFLAGPGADVSEELEKCGKWEETFKIADIIPLDEIHACEHTFNLDDHMRDGCVGCCQDMFIPALPGVQIKGPRVDGETYASWAQVYTRSELKGQWKKVEMVWTREPICKPEQFSEAMNAQKSWCTMNAPRQMDMVEETAAKSCEQCGNDLEPGAKFRGECGAPIAEGEDMQRVRC